MDYNFLDTIITSTPFGDLKPSSTLVHISKSIGLKQNSILNFLEVKFVPLKKRRLFNYWLSIIKEVVLKGLDVDAMIGPPKDVMLKI